MKNGKGGGGRVAYQVLIVEDQDIPRELFEIYVKSSGQFRHLLSISNASAALSVCRNNQVDLILMDICTAMGESASSAVSILVVDAGYMRSWAAFSYSTVRLLVSSTTSAARHWAGAHSHGESTVTGTSV